MAIVGVFGVSCRTAELDGTAELGAPDDFRKTAQTEDQSPATPTWCSSGDSPAVVVGAWSNGHSVIRFMPDCRRCWFDNGSHSETDDGTRWSSVGGDTRISVFFTPPGGEIDFRTYLVIDVRTNRMTWGDGFDDEDFTYGYKRLDDDEAEAYTCN